MTDVDRGLAALREALREQIAEAIAQSDIDLNNVDGPIQQVRIDSVWSDYLANADAVLAALPPVAGPERCGGNDPACPCRDGDVCHYVDDPESGTKAFPIPVAGPEVRPDETLRALTRQACGCLTDEDGQVIVRHDGTRPPAAPAPAPGDGPTNAEIDRVARLMMATWAECEPSHPVTLYPTSFVATFADMARAALASPAPAATEGGGQP